MVHNPDPAPTLPDSSKAIGKGKNPARPCSSKPLPISRPIISTSEDEDEDEEKDEEKEEEKEEEEEEEEGKGDDKGEDDGVGAAPDIQAMTQRLLLGYVLHGPTWLNTLFQHVAGVDVLLRDSEPITKERDNARMQVLQDSEMIGLELNHLVSEERQKVCETMLMFGLACTSAPYRSDLAMSVQPALMGSIKDIFLVNLVKWFQAAPNVMLPTAINEAMTIATSDELYEHDIVLINKQTNHLWLDLTRTFVLDTQVRVGDSAQLDLGVLNRTLANHFHPARGVGRTQAESLWRVCGGMLLQGLQQAIQDKRPDDYVFMHHDTNALPLPSAFPLVWVFDQVSQCNAMLTDWRPELQKTT
ncbi:hypothetical protein FRC10_004276 [Ceratobasidium sp. 414]|nr:hypothetical protein FRC10_004276 [Ceratobasidium sp. 414]